MTDRELLELAAKAAGILAAWDSRSNGMIVPDGFDVSSWNPLESDADALRTAVTCDMTICADGISTVSAQSGCGHDRIMVTQAVVECDDDKHAATRRVIVRVAAEIGKSMP